MNKFLILIIFITTPCLSLDMKVEPIPNSTLKVEFPSDWNFSKPYDGDKYTSIRICLPTEEHGGYPAYPEFEFEFLDSNSKDETLAYLLKNKVSSRNIGGIKSIVFEDKIEARYLASDMSHSYATLKSTGFLVPIDKGHLICTLTTQAGDAHTTYIDELKTYCNSAIESSKHNSENSEQNP